MRTNSKEVRAQIKQHILDCVTDYDDDDFEMLEAAREYVKFEFNRVANYEYNLKRIPNDRERFSDYLMGLPFSFHYTNSDIQDYLNSLGINPENKEFDIEKSISLYHNMIYKEIFG